MPAILLIAVALALAACTPPAGGPAPRAGAGDAASPLIASLSVQPGADSVRLTLQVTNAGTTPVTLSFSSGQSYDFAVRSGGTTLWTWSADRSFMQALRTETLGAGETRTWSESWTPPRGTSGSLTAVATLTSTSHPVERSTEFRLP
ncbi:BsuPI-related putative proteinase inhibitor [Longimicrobium sp.]|jgi:predicted secreted protein|uniref:BsuPI-related putative proteinase inhibitor n=1 Tax=Longimicrobium sp. TaxID=2029185 RepID=UPI002F950ECA